MPELHFVGTGEAIDPELPNTSLLYRGDRSLLLDCGWGVPRTFWNRPHASPPGLGGADELDAVYLSHTHADHAFGLPALLLWMRNAGRERPLTLFGGPGLRDWKERCLELAYPGAFSAQKCFAIETIELRPEVPEHFGALELRVARSRHGQPNHALCLRDAGIAWAYSGDGAPSPECEALYRDCTLVVHECFHHHQPQVPSDRIRHADLHGLLKMADSLALPHLALLHLSHEEKSEIRAGARCYRGNTALHLPFPGDCLRW